MAADQENRKKYGGVLKVLALAEIAINLRRELSAISLAAINAGVATGPFGFLAAGGIYAAQSAAAIIKATFNAAGVLAASLNTAVLYRPMNQRRVSRVDPYPAHPEKSRDAATTPVA